MINLRQGRGIVEVLVSRRVTETELDRLKRRLEKAVGDQSDPRVLCHLSEFWGFDSHALWQDFVYWLRYLGSPARIALLAERRWIDLFDQSRFEPPASIVMRGFEPADEQEARAWLGEGATADAAACAVQSFQ